MNESDSYVILRGGRVQLLAWMNGKRKFPAPKEM
eukprot:CAMPEP_0194062990 /NCGR_PEP_ID=MMETSP0009_2-20130614/79132_1 /TAXON_ID=210454 /ORGANISM="Grammatophora oceanica, Strain CCMP 410" /LENGTH=33 /DNA_ID= /DNA_START= /DNA_END= /DNA_ORIENTATION=